MTLLPGSYIIPCAMKYSIYYTINAVDTCRHSGGIPCRFDSRLSILTVIGVSIPTRWLVHLTVEGLQSGGRWRTFIIHPSGHLIKHNRINGGNAIVRARGISRGMARPLEALHKTMRISRSFVRKNC